MVQPQFYTDSSNKQLFYIKLDIYDEYNDAV